MSYSRMVHYKKLKLYVIILLGVDTMKKYRLNSNDGETICPNHIKINNTNLEPEEVAEQVISRFQLQEVQALKNKI